MNKLQSGPANRLLVYIACLLVAIALLTLLASKSANKEVESAPMQALSGAVAYNIDIDMDKAREETTVDHYGEGIREFVQDANGNNVNNPQAKPTAENTYPRETSLDDALPQVLPEVFSKITGEDFSQSDLQTMEKN